MQPKQCEFCKKLFGPSPSQYPKRWATTRFCSNACIAKMNSKKTSIEVSCGYCGKKSIRNKIIASRSKNNYCKECYGKAFMGRHYSPTTQFSKNHLMPKEVREKISQTMKGMPANNKGKLWSLEQRKRLSEKQLSIRESHWAWKGGITSKNKLVRRSFEMREWIKSIFCRDNYECQICGVRGNKLEAHHIVKFSENESLRLNKNNGITLCKDCHRGQVNFCENEWVSYFNFNLQTRGVYAA